MKRQGAVRVRPAKAGRTDKATAHQALDAVEKQHVAAAIERLVTTDPVRARQFLAMLKAAAESGNRRAVFQIALDFGVLGTAVAEAFRPTRLKTRSARLVDSWATVGRLIGSSMVKVAEQRDSHAR